MLDFGTLLEGFIGFCASYGEATCTAAIAVLLVLAVCALADMVDEYRYALAKTAARKRSRERSASAGRNLGAR